MSYAEDNTVTRYRCSEAVLLVEGLIRKVGTVAIHQPMKWPTRYPQDRHTREKPEVEGDEEGVWFRPVTQMSRPAHFVTNGREMSLVPLLGRGEARYK